MWICLVSATTPWTLLAGDHVMRGLCTSIYWSYTLWHTLCWGSQTRLFREKLKYRPRAITLELSTEEQCITNTSGQGKRRDVGRLLGGGDSSHEFQRRSRLYRGFWEQVLSDTCRILLDRRGKRCPGRGKDCAKAPWLEKSWCFHCIQRRQPRLGSRTQARRAKQWVCTLFWLWRDPLCVVTAWGSDLTQWLWW